MALFIAACSEEDFIGDDITNPNDADWVLSFLQVPDSLAKAPFLFEAYWNGAATAITEADSFNLKINGASIPVESYFYAGEWLVSGSDFTLTPGTQYEIKFYKNDALIVDKNIRTCYEATCTFPASYNPANDLTLNWQLSNSNQTQFVTISSSNTPGSMNVDEKTYQVSNAARSYTISANAVQSQGVGTDYEVMIMQYNNYVSGKVYITTHQGVGKVYENVLQALRDRLENARNQAR